MKVFANFVRQNDNSMTDRWFSTEWVKLRFHRDFRYRVFVFDLNLYQKLPVQSSQTFYISSAEKSLKIQRF